MTRDELDGGVKSVLMFATLILVVLLISIILSNANFVF